VKGKDTSTGNVEHLEQAALPQRWTTEFLGRLKVVVSLPVFFITDVSEIG
jgi:hypothetical protein